MEKPVVKLIGEDGNVFNILGKVSRALKDAGLPEEAKKYQEEVMACDSYDKVLHLTCKYVDVE